MGVKHHTLAIGFELKWNPLVKIPLLCMRKKKGAPGTQSLTELLDLALQPEGNPGILIN
jgi:hypothetical protein